MTTAGIIAVSLLSAASVTLLANGIFLSFEEYQEVRETGKNCIIGGLLCTILLILVTIALV